MLDLLVGILHLVVFPGGLFALALGPVSYTHLTLPTILRV